MNKGINIRLSVWHTVDFEEKLDLGEGSIIMLGVSLRYEIISQEFVINKFTLNLVLSAITIGT